MIANRRPPQLPKRRRVANPATRIIRLGRARWHARVASAEDHLDPPVGGREYVRLDGPGGACHFVLLEAGEFERLSNYRLRSLLMGLETQAAPQGRGLRRRDRNVT